jgi:hypothetical protein
MRGSKEFSAGGPSPHGRGRERGRAIDEIANPVFAPEVLGVFEVRDGRGMGDEGAAGEEKVVFVDREGKAAAK